MTDPRQATAVRRVTEGPAIYPHARARARMRTNPRTLRNPPYLGTGCDRCGWPIGSVGHAENCERGLRPRFLLACHTSGA
jgi:hypothetical protein